MSLISLPGLSCLSYTLFPIVSQAQPPFRNRIFLNSMLGVANGVCTCLPARRWRVRPDPLTDDEQDSRCKLYSQAYASHGKVNLYQSFNRRDDYVHWRPQAESDED